jgi:radical SAM protein with 4Fe4S-binding SPASM domain
LADYKNGFDFLEQLKAREPEKKQNFGSLKRYLSLKSTTSGVPTHGVFELTPLCNFDCKMCYTHLQKEQMRGRELLTVEQWKSLMHDAWEAGMMFASLTGGECLTYPGFKELYLYLRNLGVLISVLTNGALLDESWVGFFREHKPAQIMITLYGGDEETYERVTGQRKFATVTETIRRLIEAGIPLKVSVTPSKYMGEGVYKAIRMAASFGTSYAVNSFLFDPKEETGRSGQEHDLDVETHVQVLRLKNELQGIETQEIDPDKLPIPGGPNHECLKYGIPCRAGRSTFTIEWDGKMVPCSSIRQLVANPREEGFRVAWNNLRQQCSHWPRTPECEQCPYESVCIRCPAIKAQFAEPGKQPLGLCERTRYMVQRGVFHIPDCE